MSQPTDVVVQAGVAKGQTTARLRGQNDLDRLGLGEGTGQAEGSSPAECRAVAAQEGARPRTLTKGGLREPLAEHAAFERAPALVANEAGDQPRRGARAQGLLAGDHAILQPEE